MLAMLEVVVETVGRTRIVTMNRPEARNALTREVIRGVTEAFQEAGKDDGVRAVVLTGAGGHFCAGADLRKNLQEDPEVLTKADVYIDEYHALIGSIVRCPKPAIAGLDGAAVGFGADLAYACDLRVASDNAYLQEKFVKIGLMPDGGGTFWLPRLVGTSRALQMIMLADKIEAPQMRELGLVVRVVPASELREATMTVARAIEAGPPLAMAEIKRAVYASLGSIEDALRREREGQLKLLRSQDVIEGVMAWAQKRAPEFQGK
jgi:2-(1,2-epoxy-1,2-dihydrophenyl)acetyl-CoA isomerase